MEVARIAVLSEQIELQAAKKVAFKVWQSSILKYTNTVVSIAGLTEWEANMEVARIAGLAEQTEIQPYIEVASITGLAAPSTLPAATLGAVPLNFERLILQPLTMFSFKSVVKAAIVKDIMLIMDAYIRENFAKDLHCYDNESKTECHGTEGILSFRMRYILQKSFDQNIDKCISKYNSEQVKKIKLNEGFLGDISGVNVRVASRLTALTGFKREYVQRIFLTYMQERFKFR